MDNALIKTSDLVDVPNIDECPETNLIYRLETRLFNLASPPPKPEPRFYIGGVGVCTPANLTALSAALFIPYR